MGGGNIGKVMVLTFNDKEEKAVKEIIAALADSIQLEAMQPRPLPYYPFRDWKEDSTNAGYSGTEATYILPDLNTVRLRIWLLIRAWYFHRSRFLKLSGAWIVIVASPV